MKPEAAKGRPCRLGRADDLHVTSQHENEAMTNHTMTSITCWLITRDWLEPRRGRSGRHEGAVIGSCYEMHVIGPEKTLDQHAFRSNLRNGSRIRPLASRALRPVGLRPSRAKPARIPCRLAGQSRPCPTRRSARAGIPCRLAGRRARRGARAGAAKTAKVAVPKARVRR